MFFDDPTNDDDFTAPEDILADDAAQQEDGGAQEFDAQETLVTKEGLKKLKEELEYLKSVRRKEVAQRLKEAISYGDLSENSEYEEAKNEQAFVEGRILELEDKVKSAKIITEKKTEKSGKEVTVGSTASMRNTEDDEEVTYTIVGATEADPFDHKISNESPIGKAILGKRKGDIMKVQTPSGPVEYEVTKVA